VIVAWGAPELAARSTGDAGPRGAPRPAPAAPQRHDPGSSSSPAIVLVALSSRTWTQVGYWRAPSSSSPRDPGDDRQRVRAVQPLAAYQEQATTRRRSCTSAKRSASIRTCARRTSTSRASS
jgi:hypothetical protein